MKDFNNTVRELDSLNHLMGPSTYMLYDSIAKKYTKTFLEHFRSTISDGISYIAELKEHFAKYCGDKDGFSIPADKEASIDLTNGFFSKEPNGESLYFRLMDVERTMISHNDDPELDKEIQAMTGISEAEGAKGFTKKYFNDIPPVAAMTILSKFENEIGRLEKKVLQQILKANNVTPK